MIDLRSDLCSVPTEEMWEAMAAAELGWATRGEDASVNDLCERVAALLGKAAALWVPTCSMANLVALATFCERGDAVVLESASHVLTSEEMGLVDVLGLRPRSLWAPDGRMDPGDVEQAISDERATLLVLENTHTRAGGRVLSVELTTALAAAAVRHGCRVHIDGARLVNASVALGVSLAELAAPANSIAFSFTKGLSAPMGTVLAGSVAVVERAHRMVRRFGGASVHRAGIPAAAALVALDTTIHGIGDDHRRARALAAGLAGIPGLRLDPGDVETNIVLVDVSATGLTPDDMGPLLHQVGIAVLPRDGARLRLVTHRLIDDAAVDETIGAFAAVVEEHAAFREPDLPDVEGAEEMMDALDDAL